MKPEFPHLTREELEVRLTALLLGELPPAEAEAVRQLAARDAALGQMLARLEKASQLVREGLTVPGEEVPATQPPLKLAPEKRAQLLAHFQKPPPTHEPSAGARTFLSASGGEPGQADKNVRAPAPVTPEQMGLKRIQPKRWKYRRLAECCVVGAVMLLLAGLLLPSLATAKKKSMRHYATSLPGRGNPMSLSANLSETTDPVTALPLPPPPPEPEQLRMKIALPAATEDATLTVAAGSAGSFAWGGGFFGSGGGGAGGRSSGGGYGGGANLPAASAASAATQPAPEAKPTETTLGFALQDSYGRAADQKPPERITLTGVVNVAGTRKAILQPGTPPPVQAGEKAGFVAAADDVEFGVPASGQTWAFENRGQVAAGKPLEVATKSELADRIESRGRGATAAPQDSANKNQPARAEHVFADTDGLGLDGASTLSRGKNPTLSGRTTSLASSAPVAPAGPAAGSSASQPAGSIRLPMPALKGTPESLPAAANIENLGETVAQAKANWDVLQKSVAEAPAANPAPSLAPEMQARFARRYGITPPSSQAAAPAKDDRQLSTVTLGDTPMLGTLFKEKAAEKDGDLGIGVITKRVDALASGVQNLYANSVTNSVAGNLNFQFPPQEKAQADGSWFDSSGSQRSEGRFNGKAGVAIVLPAAGQVVNGRADALVEDGKQFFEAGRLPDAADKFAKARAAEPGNQTAHYYAELATAALTAGAHRAGRPAGQTEVTADWVETDLNAPLTAGRKLALERKANTPVQDGAAPATGSLAAGRGLAEERLAEGLEKQLFLAREAKAPTQTAAFETKKRELEEAIRFRNIASLKMLSEKTDVNRPKTAMVEIVDPAAAPSKPTGSLWDRAKQAVTGAPDQYESTARITAERDVSDINPIGAKSTVAGAYDPYFIQTEFEALQSGPILDKVAEKLKLSEKWGEKSGDGQKLTPEKTRERLKSQLDLRPERNSSLLAIAAKSDQPEEAALIANTLAEVYRDYRAEQRKQISVRGIEPLQGQFTEQDKQIAKLQQELEQLRSAGSASDPAEPPPPPKPPANAPIPQPEVASAENAFSTFSLNVADVSFKLAQASLEKGQMPDAAAIRSEEFINAFDYRDPEAAAGQPVAFVWERARFPFAHHRDALRFSVKTAAAGRQGNRPLNLVLLLDNSGSMERADRSLIIQQALRVLAGQLQPQDRVSVVTFARTPRLWLDATAGDKAGAELEKLGTLTPQGGTDLGAALQLGYETARRHYLPAGLNRVVLLTDGAANLGDVDPDSLKRLVEKNRQQGVALDCFGIGWEGYNDDLLEVLSRNGDGRYGFVNTPEAAATEFAAQLAGALQVAASDVKVQVEFNPTRVTNWRQVGYAKHQLTKEQFRDNAVDAAEIAAQEAGNGLYVIEVNPSGQGPLATVRVRFKVPGTSDYRELEWPVPYAGSAMPLEQASPAMRLLVASAEFSEWLASSPFSAEVSPDRLLGLLGGVPAVYGADERPKKLEWMIRQAKSLSGK